jgi:hypothetical protein
MLRRAAIVTGGAAVILALASAPMVAPRAAPLDYGTTRTRMGRHGVGLTGLGRSVVLLDLPTTVRLARQIADDETLAVGVGAMSQGKAGPGETFAALQEELRARAGRLADEASQRDDLGVADAFGELAKTCVRCHRLYLRPGPRTAP